jgi:AraC-like DNA-binding protein
VEGEGAFDTFVPGSRVGKALSLLARKHQLPSLGLTMARATPIGSFGAFDHAVWTGGTLRDAIARSSHFYSLVTEGVSLALEVHGGRAHVTMHAPRAARHGWVLTDIALALNVQRAREATGEQLRLQGVSFRHRATDPTPYEAFFRTKVGFEAPTDAVVFDATLLELGVRTPDRVAAVQVERHATALAAGVASGDPFLDRVRAGVLRGLWNKDQSLARLAKELGVGSRTLQRQLRDQGTSHRGVSDGVRREIALQLLRRPEPSILEVAYEVGFGRLQAFYRAFARWTGTTPASYRSSARATQAANFG